MRDLAARCQQGGYPELTEGALYVLEGPRPRKVTVDEWLVLAYVLGVPPPDAGPTNREHRLLGNPDGRNTRVSCS